MTPPDETETPCDACVRLAEVTRSRHIAPTVRYTLWGRAAGRCQFRGCNKPLWRNPVTQEAVNIAETAHIYAFSSDGPRGNKGVPSELLNRLENLLLACHDCHKTIDEHQRNGGRYSVELLQTWKAAHEERVERVTGINPEFRSHVVLYDRAIGGMHSPVRLDRASAAMFPNRYPAENQAIELANAGSDATERDDEFWAAEMKDLERKFERKIHDRLARGDIEHLSVFAIAPMPLLIRLGTLLTDIRPVDVYQFHREPKGWAWPEDDQLELTVDRPSKPEGVPALVIALSAMIDDSRIHKALGDEVAVWRLTIPSPTQECVRSKSDLAAFSKAVRSLLNEIKATHGHDAVLSVFPTAPVSTMVELGRAHQPKADMSWVVYDENRDLGGFVKAIEIGQPR